MIIQFYKKNALVLLTLKRQVSMDCFEQLTKKFDVQLLGADALTRNSRDKIAEKHLLNYWILNQNGSGERVRPHAAWDWKKTPLVAVAS